MGHWSILGVSSLVGALLLASTMNRLKHLTGYGQLEPKTSLKSQDEKENEVSEHAATAKGFTPAQEAQQQYSSNQVAQQGQDQRASLGLLSKHMAKN